MLDKNIDARSDMEQFFHESVVRLWSSYLGIHHRWTPDK